MLLSAWHVQSLTVLNVGLCKALQFSIAPLQSQMWPVFASANDDLDVLTSVQGTQRVAQLDILQHLFLTIIWTGGPGLLWYQATGWPCQPASF